MIATFFLAWPSLWLRLVIADNNRLKMENFNQIVQSLFEFSLVIYAGLFLPQAWKVWRSQSGKDISLIIFGRFHLIQTLGMLHGYYQRDFSLLLGMVLNNVTCGLVTVLAFKCRQR